MTENSTGRDIMNILGINGSPRIKGNTDTLLDKVLEGAADRGAETCKIILSELKFSGCLECDYESDSDSCRLDDDMRVVFESIKRADGLVLASPVFFGTITGQTKLMIDRFQCIWRTKYVLKKKLNDTKKKGAFLCVEASKKESYFLNAKSIIQVFFNVIDVSYDGELFCPGLDEKGSVLKHQEYLDKAFELGRRFTV